jgi:uncharacterized protein involved in exopolysaccharide biosynthesis
MQPNGTLGDYWTALYSSKWIILAVTLSSMGFSIWLSHYLPPVYEAKATFYVPVNAQVPGGSSGATRGPLQTILKPAPDEKEAGLVIGVLKGQDLGRRVRELFPQKDPAFFTKSVDFTASPQFFIDIYVRDSDPKFAAEVANAYMQAYRDFHTDKLRANALEAAAALQSQYKSLTDRLDKKTLDTRNYQVRNQLLSEGETEGRYSAQVRDVERRLDEITIEVQSARARLGIVSKRPLPIDGEPVTEVLPLGNPAREALRGLEARQAALAEQLDSLRAGSRGAISKVSELQSLNAERSLLRGMLSNVESSLAEARLQSESAQALVVTVQTAQPPSQPGFPIAGLNGGVGLVLGFIAGCYNALLLEYLRLRRLAKARRQLDYSLLSEVST